ncbi:hypothetical protein BDK51DRAFT_48547 [Blyttiomyces helicus]|uniref:Nucleotide exchange factor Fes1 domain-containing protein n=1 Tax=Blyttiomyces helicus TaxID=388810 RepID=A0A4P9WD49_9FUNG|nr:hypothetical protein BDK51DRAFT_48547 [Blyttiomyces helicus]|eukprot:RKO89563.1 hypothetical protein BDK51DRAFT_48547 [Blyttiomyces helicus]
MPNQISQSELLQWAVTNQPASGPAPAQTPAPPLERLDPKWIEVLLGKEDAARMKGAFLEPGRFFSFDAVRKSLRNCVVVIEDPAASLDEKLVAFDELELASGVVGKDRCGHSARNYAQLGGRRRAGTEY